jgi:hypothetical protein
MTMTRVAQRLRAQTETMYASRAARRIAKIRTHQANDGESREA